jgi:hypothetical protein
MRDQDPLALTEDPHFRAGHKLAATLRVEELEVLVALCTQDLGPGYVRKLGRWARRLVNVDALSGTRMSTSGRNHLPRP